MTNNPPTSYSIVTYGCQMNKNDSERIAGFFSENGLQKSSVEKADVVVINSCSIRQSAVDRIEGKIRNLKKDKNRPLIIVTGCLLEKDRKKFSSLVDYTLPTETISSWPLSFLKEKNTCFFNLKPERTGTTAYVSIMTGCNNFCAYCVVPYTKGREFSRPVTEVIEEVKKSVKNGYREVWLLGQNVNSYNGGVDFPKLLREINKIRGDFWLRFTTSHPKDFSDKTISAIKDCKKITKYLHLPIQSGDNTILEKMNRPYTVQDYREIIRKVRKEVPDITISTDIIVGFPGETEKNFRNTATIFNEIRFDMAYVARYSPRPQTSASKMEETVSEEEKKRREKILVEILKESNLEKNKLYKGKKVRVLVIKKSKKKGFLFGKTEDYKTILFRGSEKLIGKFIKAEITDYSLWGLKGKINQK